MGFKNQLDKLDELVNKLESKDTGLEEGIALYEEGLALTRELLKSLSESKGKIAIIKKEMDRLTEEPYKGE